MQLEEDVNSLYVLLLLLSKFAVAKVPSALTGSKTKHKTVVPHRAIYLAINASASHTFSFSWCHKTPSLLKLPPSALLFS